jgi:hypothetical protein
MCTSFVAIIVLETLPSKKEKWFQKERIEACRFSIRQNGLSGPKRLLKKP